VSIPGRVDSILLGTQWRRRWWHSRVVVVVVVVVEFIKYRVTQRTGLQHHNTE